MSPCYKEPVGQLMVLLSGIKPALKQHKKLIIFRSGKIPLHGKEQNIQRGSTGTGQHLSHRTHILKYTSRSGQRGTGDTNHQKRGKGSVSNGTQGKNLQNKSGDKPQTATVSKEHAALHRLREDVSEERTLAVK